MLCKSKVRVMSPAPLDYVAFTAHADEVQRLVTSNRAVISETDPRGLVCAIRLIEGGACEVTASPGSFGIVRQPVNSERVHTFIYQHHPVSFESARAA